MAVRQTTTYTFKCDHPGCHSQIAIPGLNIGQRIRDEDYVEEVLQAHDADKYPWQFSIPPRTLPVELLSGAGKVYCPRHHKRFDAFA